MHARVPFVSKPHMNLYFTNHIIKELKKCFVQLDMLETALVISSSFGVTFQSAVCARSI